MNHGASERSHIQAHACRFLPACMEDLGLDVDRLLHKNGLSRELLAQPENLLPIEKVSTVLEQAAREANCPTFGMKVGLCGGLHTMAPISEGILGASTLQGVLSMLCRSFSLYNRGARLDFRADGDIAELRFIILDPGVHSGEQLSECAIAEAYNVVRQLCPDWRPHLVCLPSSAPWNEKDLSKAFSSKIKFNSVCASLQFRASYCSRPVSTSVLKREVVLSNRRVPITDAVAWACSERYLQGRDPSSDRVARDIGLSRRTLHRRLLMEGTTFREVLDGARLGAAERLIRDTDMSMTVVALSLGYSELSAFTRAFHRHFGCTPSAFRATRLTPEASRIGVPTTVDAAANRKRRPPRDEGNKRCA